MNAYAETHTLTLAKDADRQLRGKVIESNLTGLLASVNNKSLKVRGWTLDTPAEGETWAQFDTPGGDKRYTYEAYLTITYTRQDGKTPDKADLSSIVRTLNTRASAPAYGRWTVSKLDGSPYTVAADDNVTGSGTEMLGYSEVTMPDATDWWDNFSHLFGLDSHISRVQYALEAGIESGWSNRYHVALIGPPGCGKSDICQTIKRALGDDAVMELDATATTAAGAIKDLSEREILPRILIVEEIEKADDNTMRFLLGVLDQRAEIRKVTARGTIQRDTKLFAICTVNDLALFNKMQAGALASRFANKVGFKRPTREHLALILTRELGKINGDPEWIAPTLDYCEEHGITDPRRVASICLCGRDALLTGEYQKMLDDTAVDASQM